MSSPRADTATVTDGQLLSELRRGDDAAFGALLERYHGSLVELAETFLADSSVAETLARDAWLALLGMLATLEEGVSPSRWLFGIVIERARAISPGTDTSADELLAPVVDPERFRGPDEQYHGGWRIFPPAWAGISDDALRSREVRGHVRVAVKSLPAAQQRVVILRDVHGCTATEVSDLLGISDTTQRALLQRGRARVREALASFLTGE